MAGRIEVGHVARLRVRLAELSQGRVSRTGVGWECERGLRAWLSAIGSRCCDGSDHRGREVRNRGQVVALAGGAGHRRRIGWQRRIGGG